MKRHKKKISYLLILALATSILFSGCGGEPLNTQVDMEMITCTDSIGREVQVPKEPKTIAALDSFSAQAVFVLGEGDRIIAAPGGIQRDELLQQISPSLANSSVAMGGGSINAEEILRIKPDVIFIKGDIYSTESEKTKLDELGIPFLVINYSDMKSQMEAMDIIGKALGKSELADKYRKNYEDTIDLVSERVKDIPESELPRIYHSVNEAVRTDGPGTLGADWISVTRAINVSVDQPLKYAESNYYSTLEQIYSWNPEIIICNESGVPEYILTDQKWEGLDAVAHNKVYQMPIGASRWGHQGSAETALALLWLAKQLYPEQFKDIDLYERTMEFYDTFYRYAVTPETMRLILSGKGLRESVSNPSDI
jgi:iron complex transport system substrate-binding protein